MRKGEYFSHIGDAEYQHNRVQEVPSVRFYDLSSTEDRISLDNAIRTFPETGGILPWSFSGKRALKRAHARGIFINDFSRHLTDKAKLDYPAGYFAGRPEELDAYIQSNDKAENSVVAEFSWKKEGRFVRLPQEDDFYQIMTSRDTLIIPEEVKEKLKTTKIAIAGMGVGASIGYLLVQSGAKQLTVADGGLIDLHDFNRYPHTDVTEIGENHAVNFAKMAYETNPYIRIDCYPQNVSTHGQSDTVSANQLFGDADILIEEVDNLPMKYALRKTAKRLQVPIIMGTDIGTSGLVHFEYPRDEPFFGRLTENEIDLIQNETLSFAQLTELAVKIIGGHNDRDKLLEKAAQKKLPFWPQDGGAARKSAAGVRDAIVAYLGGQIVQSETMIT